MTQMLLFSSCITSQENQRQPQKALQISAILIPTYITGAAAALAGQLCMWTAPHCALSS